MISYPLTHSSCLFAIGTESCSPKREKECLATYCFQSKIFELVLANSPSVYIHTVVRTLWLHRVCFGPWLSKQLLLRTTLITLNAREYPNGLYNKYHKIYLSGPFGISVLRHPTESSPLLAGASNRKHHHYPTIPRGPCWSKSRVFSGILTVYFNC